MEIIVNVKDVDLSIRNVCGIGNGNNCCSGEIKS